LLSNGFNLCGYAEGTHDSVEDAKMALELAKWEAVNGPTAEMDPPEVGAHSLPGARLVHGHIPAVINWCSLLDALLGLFTPGCQIGYIDRHIPAVIS
jgi:hypothetical protein